MTFTTGHRSTQVTDFFELMGVGVTIDNDGKTRFVLKEKTIPEIKASTWDCILLDLLHDKAFESGNHYDPLKGKEAVFALHQGKKKC